MNLDSDRGGILRRSGAAPAHGASRFRPLISAGPVCICVPLCSISTPLRAGRASLLDGLDVAIGSVAGFGPRPLLFWGPGSSRRRGDHQIVGCRRWAAPGQDVGCSRPQRHRVISAIQISSHSSDSRETASPSSSQMSVSTRAKWIAS